jgi:hypothetical protein
MKRFRIYTALFAAATVLVSSGQAFGNSIPDYDGGLTWAGGGILAGPANNNWANTGTILEWTADYDAGTEIWSYWYRLTVGADPAISHFILNVSESIQDAKVFDVGISHKDENPFEIKLHEPNKPNKKGKLVGGNPGLPYAFYGIKGETTGSPKTLVMTIETTREPMWGHFYAKGGSEASGGGGIWNVGLGTPVDYTLPYDTLKQSYLLVPDTQNGSPPPAPPLVPEPLTALALLGGVGAAGRYVRRRGAK